VYLQRKLESTRFKVTGDRGDVQLFKMSSPAPKSPEQSEKSKKYDRQLRFVSLLFVNVSVIAQVSICGVGKNTML
jgi:hypothetical protein